jgi:hypothetical protein
MDKDRSAAIADIAARASDRRCCQTNRSSPMPMSIPKTNNCADLTAPHPQRGDAYVKISRAREPDERFDIDESASDTPPRRPSNAPQCGPSYLWNGTHQQLIPVLPEDHPNYRENRELVRKMIRLWDQGKSK